MEPETVESSPLDYVMEHSDEIAEHVSQYGYLVGDSLFLIALGMLAVFLLHKIVSKFLYRFVNNSRLIRVVFGTLYVMVLVITVLMALKHMGFETSKLGSIALLVVMVGAIVTYFLVPFFPRLPFVPGHTIESGGVMGTVDAVSSFHTTMRKFDGTMVFLPNAMMLASRILNYSYAPTRRIEMTLVVSLDSDLDTVSDRLLKIVSANEMVVSDPAAPAIYAVGADATGVQMTIYCWVDNADFLGARSELWLSLVQACKEDSGIALALPRQEVVLKETA